jgi:nitrate reductase gamma subunit
MNDTFFLALPYAALVVAVVGGIHRYFSDRFSFSSISSQLLEKRMLFWGVVPWHYGIVPILIAHLLAILFPGLWGGLLGGPLRVTIWELAGMALGLFSLAGVIILIARRLFTHRARRVTSVMDWILLVLLCLQVGLGLGIAVFYRWGGLWYLHTAVPWLRSLAILQPNIAPVVTLPTAVRIHMLNGFVLILLFPFTRLVHIFTFPFRYLLRPWQVVIWNHRPASMSARRK